MPPAAEVQQYLSGAWRLMLGREDGLDRLDLSVDGFWNSFFAMVVSLPALAVGWVTVANRLGGTAFGDRVGVLFRLGVIDFLAWVVPLALLALVAKRTGIAHRYIHYVVASNWGSVLLNWLMAPVSVIELVFPRAVGATDALSLVILLATLVLSWRLTRASLGMGTGVASAVFGGVFAASLAVILTLQPLFGLSVQ